MFSYVHPMKHEKSKAPSCMSYAITKLLRKLFFIVLKGSSWIDRNPTAVTHRKDVSFTTPSIVVPEEAKSNGIVTEHRAFVHMMNVFYLQKAYFFACFCAFAEAIHIFCRAATILADAFMKPSLKAEQKRCSHMELCR